RRGPVRIVQDRADHEWVRQCLRSRQRSIEKDMPGVESAEVDAHGARINSDHARHGSTRRGDRGHGDRGYGDGGYGDGGYGDGGYGDGGYGDGGYGANGLTGATEERRREQKKVRRVGPLAARLAKPNRNARTNSP